MRRPNNRKGFSVLEVVAAISVLAGFSFLITQILSQQTNLQKVAEIKASMNTLLVHAQYATKRYELLHLENEIINLPGLSDCFKGSGIDCENQNSGRPEFPAVDVEMNALLRAEYTLDGIRCAAGANCPLQVTTEWNFDCDENICRSIEFLNNVKIDSTFVENRNLIPLLSAIPAIEANSNYSSKKQIGLVKTLNSSCESATAVNFGAGVVGCTPTAGTSANQLFSSELGFNYQNSDLRLLASDGTPKTECPPGTISTMVDGAIVCNEECTILCTNPGWITQGCRCCNPNSNVAPDACNVVPSTCSTGLIFQNGRCCNPNINVGPTACSVTPPTVVEWGPVYAFPSQSVYSQRRRCLIGTRCQNTNWDYHFVINGVKYAHQCVRGGRWDNKEKICKPPIGYVQTGHSCRSDEAIANKPARGSAAHINTYNWYRNHGARIPAWPGATNYGYGMTTAHQACLMNGYNRAVTITKKRRWDTPENNYMIMWVPSANTFTVQNAASAGNAWMSSGEIVCQGRIHQSCIDEWQWMFW